MPGLWIENRKGCRGPQSREVSSAHLEANPAKGTEALLGEAFFDGFLQDVLGIAIGNEDGLFAFVGNHPEELGDFAEAEVAGVVKLREKVFAAVVKAVEVFFEEGGEGGRMVGGFVEAFGQESGGEDGLAECAHDAGLGLFEEVDLAVGGGAVGVCEFAFAVAAAGGLGEGVEAGEGAEDGGEVEVDAGFDEGGGDDIGGGVGLEAFADLGDDVAAVGGAHPGAEVEGVAGLEGVEGGVEVAGVLAGVDDAEGALFLGDAVGEIGPLHAAEEVVVDAAECGVEAVDVGSELGGTRETKGREVGLGGGAEDDGAAVVGDEAAEELGAGGEELFGEFLGFVEDDDAEKKDSKNWTLVVTTTGTPSQFSVS